MAVRVLLGYNDNNDFVPHHYPKIICANVAVDSLGHNQLQHWPQANIIQ